MRGIEHKINLVHEASILNRSAYVRNLEEIKELQRQVYELIDKGYILLFFFGKINDIKKKEDVQYKSWNPAKQGSNRLHPGQTKPTQTGP